MADATDGSEPLPNDRGREWRHYETVFETLGDAAYALDTEGRFGALNEAFESATGYGREELLGEHASAVVDSAGVEAGETAIRELLGNDERGGVRFEVELLTADGERVPYENHVTVLRTASGAFRGTVGVLRDITERRERERTLREERAFVDDVLDAVPDVLYVIDENGRYLRWNDQLAEITGYTDKEIARMHPTDLVPDEEVETIMEAIGTAVETGESRTVDSQLLRKTGEVVPYRFTGSVATDSAGSIQGIVGTAQDISEREERQRTLEALHDATRAMMTATAREEVCEIAADASKRVLGYPITVVRLLADDGETLVPAAMTTQTPDRVDERPEYSVRGTPAGRVYEAGEARVYEDVHDTDDDYDRGAIRAAMYTPLGDHGVISLGDTQAGTFDRTDISLASVLAANTEAALDRVRREARLRTREAELRRHNARIEEFASVVSHDIRNPLNVIMGNVALARETGDVSYLQPVERAADRVNRLADDLLTLVRQGGTVNDPQRTPIAPVIEDAWAAVGCKSARLTVDDRLSAGSSSEYAVEADPIRLGHLFENLLANAVEHGGPEVRIEVGPLPDDAGFYVADDGPGIRPEIRERVFDHDYTTIEHGLGLGLTIVETVADAHGWTIETCESEHGGARFEFRTG